MNASQSSQSTEFTGPAGRLEGRLLLPENPTAAAVVAHPHPLYGGTMDNAVVRRVADALAEAGISVLRFNFRGVGRSQGVHDHGAGEISDLRAAATHLLTASGNLPLWLVGYSFGAATVLNLPAETFREHRIDAALLLAPPLSHYDFSSTPLATATPRPAIGILHGELDEFTAPDHRHVWASWQLRAEIELPAVGHDLGASGGGTAARFREAVDTMVAQLRASHSASN